MNIYCLAFIIKNTDMEIAASIKGASKEYKTGDTVITALQPTTFDFMKKELTLIIGPSGSGKSTLLSLLGCVIFPTPGEVYIDNILLNNLSEKELARVRLKSIGFVFQSFNLLAPLNALENVMQPLRLSTLVTDPSIMLCDEPTASLDIRSVSIVMEELKMLSDSGKLVIVVTHDLRLNPFADRIIYMNNGIASDKPSIDELFQN
jgi:putative ABC transport system ATP-binding protein